MYRKQSKWYQIIGDEVKNVWNPDIIFLHVTNIKTLTKYGSKEKFNYWLNTEKNLMQYWESILVTFSCSFNYKNYPFDENSCDFSFGCESQGLSKLNFSPINILLDDGNISILSENFDIKNTHNHLPYDISIKAQENFNSFSIGYSETLKIKTFCKF